MTAFDARSFSKEEHSKPPIDPNNDSSRHWLTYPNPKTPQYILDIKQRLGQYRVPSTLVARPSSASVQRKTPQPIARPSSASTQRQQKPQSANDDQHHFLTIRTRDTPEELRATRYRIDKNRYNPSLDNYPPRPQTCPVRTAENPKSITLQESTTEQPAKIDAWTAEEEKRSFIPEHESSSVLIQMVDCDGLPNEYVDALDTANIAQEEYQRSLKINGERRPENLVYRLPENRNDSFVSQQSLERKRKMFIEGFLFSRYKSSLPIKINSHRPT